MTYSFEWSQIGLESNCIHHDSQMTKPRCERFAKKFWASYGHKVWKIGVRRDGNACVQQVLINGWVSGRRSQARQLCRVSMFRHLLNNYQQRASLSPWGPAMSHLRQGPFSGGSSDSVLLCSLLWFTQRKNVLHWGSHNEHMEGQEMKSVSVSQNYFVLSGDG